MAKLALCLIFLILGGCSKIGTITNMKIVTSGISSSIVLNDHSVTEGSTQTVTFTLAKTYDRDVVVQWVVSGAGVGSDITITSGTTTILQGQTTGTFNITTIDNAIYDLTRDYQLDVNVIDPASEVISKTFSVTDNESLPVVQFTAPTQNVPENAILPIATLSIAPASKFNITVNMTVAGTATGSGVDHGLSTGSLVIPALATTHNIALSVVDDAIMEALETINMTLTSATSGAIGANSNHIATIIDDETSYLSVSDISVSESGVATFTVSVTGTPVVPITFDWATANGTGTSAADYFTTSGTGVTITPPATSTTITVNTRDDALTCETDRTFLVLISNVVGAAVGDPSAVATITDPDVPALTFTSATSSVAEGATASVPVQLATACATKDISFTVTSASVTATATGPTADYTPLTSVPGTITAGNTTTNVTVVTLDDARDENDETLTLTLAGTTLGAPSVNTLTINDDDLAPTISIPATLTHTEATGAGTANLTYTITASAVSDLNITVNYATSAAGAGYLATAPADYTATSGTATITAGTLTTTFTIPVVRDSMDEYDEVFNVTLSGGANYTAAGSILASQVTITDDDDPPTISIVSPIEVSEDIAGFGVTVNLSAASGKVVSFDLTSTDGTANNPADYGGVSVNNATIAAGSTSRSFLVSVEDDSVNCELTETFSVTLSDLQNATAGTPLVASGTIEENDIPILSMNSPDVIEGATATLTPTLNLACPNNVTFDWQTISTTATAGDDFSHLNGTITFLAGQLTASTDINIPTVDDTYKEVEERFFVAVHNSGPIKGTPGVVTIRDNEGGVGIAKVSVGNGYACALSNQGDVKCWGNKNGGLTGQILGHKGDQASDMGNALLQMNFGDSSGTPYQVSKIVRGSRHNCAILNNGRLKCWGYSYITGSMGDHYGENGNGLPFVDLGTDGGGLPWQVTDIAVTAENTCALLSNQRIKCWGAAKGIHGQTDFIGDSPAEMGNALPFIDLGGSNKVLKLTSGGEHVCALLDDEVGPAGDGDIKCWGVNTSGSLGQNSTLSTPNSTAAFGSALPFVDLGTGVKATDVIAGMNTTCALVDTNLIGSNVKCWGQNSSGQLGINSSENIGNGYDDAAPLVPVNEMGDNLEYAQLGGARVTNLYVGTLHVCAILDDNGNKNDGGNLRCWGDNNWSQLGNGSQWNPIGDAPGEMASLGSVNLGTGLKAYDVSLNGYSTCALTQSGVKCWGHTFRGQLGDPFTAQVDGTLGNVPGELGDALPFVNLGAVTVTSLGRGSLSYGNIAEAAHHCAIIQGGTSKCWGDDRWSQLLVNDGYIGDGPGEMGAALPIVDLGTGVKAKDIAAGEELTCVLTTDDRVKCWGIGIYLGNGGYYWVDIGDDPNEMGDNLPFHDFGPGRKVQSLSVGSGRGCAILDNFETKCWGAGHQGDVQGVGGVAYGGPDLSVVPPLNFGKDRYAIMMSGKTHNGCALLDNLRIKCWGYNGDAQLLLDPATFPFFGNTLAQDGDDLHYLDLGTNLKFTNVVTSDRSSCAVTTDQRLKCWGLHAFSALGTGESYNQTIGWLLGDVPAERGDGIPFVNLNNEPVYDVTVGTCVIAGTNRELKCWGQSPVHGRGSAGSVYYWGDNPSEMGAGLTALPIGAGRKALSISSRNNVACVVLDNGDLKCCGNNDTAQLGRGDRIVIGDDPGEFAAIAPMDLGF